MNRQYIGARYVPKIFDNNGSNEWVSGISYEALTVVTYLNNSYTSKKNVPSNIGAPNLNTEYWVNIGNYNAQINELNNRVTVIESTYDKIYNSVNAMKSDTSISNGMHLKTTGYYAKGDYGWGEYVVVNEEPNEYYEELQNGLYDILIGNRENIVAYGAKTGHNSSTAIQNAIDNNNGGTIIVPIGEYIIDTAVSADGINIEIVGCGTGSILNCTASIQLNGPAESHYSIRNIHFKGTKCIEMGTDTYCINAEVKNCFFEGVGSAIELNNECDNIVIECNHFLRCSSAVKTADTNTNRTGVRIQFNHFQMQPSTTKSLELNMMYNLHVSDNIFQCSGRVDITFIKVNAVNGGEIINNYFELSSSETPSSNLAISVGELATVKICENAFAGYYTYLIEINYPTFNCVIGRIYYSAMGNTLTAYINNKIPNTVKDSERVILDYDYKTIRNNAVPVANSYNAINTFINGIVELTAVSVTSEPQVIDVSYLDTYNIKSFMCTFVGNIKIAPIIIDLGQNYTEEIGASGSLAFSSSGKSITITKDSTNISGTLVITKVY